jgi:wobble nucleotide-excising tRNase
MRLMFNKSSSFFAGLDGFDIESKIRELLIRYDNYMFSINYEDGYITFSRKAKNARNEDVIEENIKISRGEESIFIWCLFLAIAEMAIGGIPEYSWVKYIYVDDPISSLDDNNVVAVACHLAQLLKNGDIKTIISTHHTLFFNVMFNELSRGDSFVRYLGINEENGKHYTRGMDDTPFYHHVALLQQLKEASVSGKLYTYHFNVLRNLFEKTAAFHGYDKFYDCVKLGNNDEDNGLYNRMVNLMSHGAYSIFEPVEMVDDNKQIFKEILVRFLREYNFNEALFEETEE